MGNTELTAPEEPGMVHVPGWGYFTTPSLPQHLIDDIFGARASLWHVLKYLGDERLI
jgi:hypothetical protein